MAKLSAHGTEVLRMIKTFTSEFGRDGRHEAALMNDGAVLEKLTIAGHNYGWKLRARHSNQERFVAWYTKLGYGR